MRWDSAALGLFAFALAAAIGCGGSGHDTVTITTQTSFGQGFLPVPRSTSSGDVSLKIDGPIFAVDCQTATVTAISQTDGQSSPYAQNVGDNRPLCSITVGFGDDGRLFAGDNNGKIWVIATGATVVDRTSALFADTGTPSQAITGLAFAPNGFGQFGGQLFAARDGGLFRMGNPPEASRFGPAGDYIDLAFSASELFAIKVTTNLTTDEIEKIDSNGSVLSAQEFAAPVGIAVDSTTSEVYVADAGADVLYTMPLAGGAPKARAAYEFAATAPSGIAHDGLAALVFITSDAIRGANLPRVDPDNANFTGTFAGPTTGYGDLEFDRTGSFILVANDPATKSNFLFSAQRDLSVANALNSGIHEDGAQPGEQLLSLAIDPQTQAIYIGTDLGNLYRRASDGTVTQLIDSQIDSPSGAPSMLGLELAPREVFCAPVSDPCLVATTATGRVIVIDLAAPDLDEVIHTEPGAGGSDLARLSDLVFASDGTLYVVDCDDADPPVGSKILQIARIGDVVDSLEVDGRIDGIEIDEGGDRLLVTALTAGPDQLLEIPLSLDAAPTPLENIDIDDGFFPTGIVYDRLGTAVLRRGNASTGLDAVDVSP